VIITWLLQIPLSHHKQKLTIAGSFCLEYGAQPVVLLTVVNAYRSHVSATRPDHSLWQGISVSNYFRKALGTNVSRSLDKKCTVCRRLRLL